MSGENSQETSCSSFILSCPSNKISKYSSGNINVALGLKKKKKASEKEKLCQWHGEEASKTVELKIEQKGSYD